MWTTERVEKERTAHREEGRRRKESKEQEGEEWRGAGVIVLLRACPSLYSPLNIPMT